MLQTGEKEILSGSNKGRTLYVQKNGIGPLNAIVEIKELS